MDKLKDKISKLSIKEEKRLLKEKEKRDAFNKEFDKLELSYYDIEDGGILLSPKTLYG